MLFSLALILGIVRATWLSARERYWVGVVAGVVRLGLLALSWYAMVGAWGLVVPAAPTRGLLLLSVCNFVGPLVTLVTIVLAYRRFHDVPAAQEERAQRPFRAWLPPAIVDATMLLIIFGGMAIGLGD